jgi:hypothetical protein
VLINIKKTALKQKVFETVFLQQKDNIKMRKAIPTFSDITYLFLQHKVAYFNSIGRKAG